jgi:hypothetical protein
LNLVKTINGNSSQQNQKNKIVLVHLNLRSGCKEYNRTSIFIILKPV